MLFNVDIRQNFSLEELNLKKNKNKQKKSWNKSLR